jgi:hypothetical protein
MNQNKTSSEKLPLSGKSTISMQKVRQPMALTVRSGLHAGYYGCPDCYHEYQICSVMCGQQ